MDWFSWLSKSSLDPSLVYEYGLSFARNELQSDDIPYFNHEFLQSMGIPVAKHRLEILKLAGKHSGQTPATLSGLLKNTRRRLNKYLAKWVSHAGDPPAIMPAPGGGGLLRRFKSDKDFPVKEHKPKKRIALSGPLNGKAQERLVAGAGAGAGYPRSLKLSGPLDGKAQERFVFPAKMNELRLSGPLDGKVFVTNKSPKLSGPLDGKFMMVPPIGRSPKLSGPLDGRAMSPMGCNHGDGEFDDHLIWAALFDDMKPT